MTDFVEPSLYVDDRLLCKEKIGFPVVKGAQNISYQKFVLSNTPVSNQMNFNIQVPSQNTIVSRQVRLRAVLRFVITGFDDANDRDAFKALYGSQWSLCAYPLHNCIQNASVQINDNSVSIQMNEWLAPLTHMLSDEEHYYNSNTPSLPDRYGDYTSVELQPNNPLGAYGNMTGCLHGRGSYPISYDNDTANSTRVSIDVSEYLMMSPFLYGDYENQGFYGINNLVFNFVLSNGINPSILRTNLTDAPYANITVSNFEIAEGDMMFCFLTNHPSQALPSPRNVVPYTNINVNTTALNAIANGGTGVQSSQSFQLNSIPDKVWIFARPIQTQRGRNYADSVLPLTDITISFNNTQGLLSASRPQDLWFMSKQSGVHLDWNEWNGNAKISIANVATDARLTGSWLCLQFGKDIAISDDFFAPSSIGQFNFQYTATFRNNTGANITNNYQLYTIFSYNGVLVNDRGNTIVYQSLFTKEDILNISTRPPVSMRKVERLLGQGRSGGGLSGGGWWDSMKSIGSAIISPALDLVAPMVPGGNIVRGIVRTTTGLGKNKASILDEYTL